MPSEHAQTVHINLEFAHVEFSGDGYFDHSAVEKSAALAKELFHSYQSRSLSCATAILIDDKQVPQHHRLSVHDIDPLLRIATGFLPVDFISFESRLPTYKDQLLGLLDPAHRRIVGRDMDYYENRDGRIACSHDIAIWHMLRLGYIGPITPDVAIPVAAFSARGLPPFTCRRAVSVLSRDLHHDDFETLAEEKILRHSVINGLSARIERVYVEDTEAAGR